MPAQRLEELFGEEKDMSRLPANTDFVVFCRKNCNADAAVITYLLHSIQAAAKDIETCSGRTEI